MICIATIDAVYWSAVTVAGAGMAALAVDLLREIFRK